MKLNTELSHEAEYLGDVQENRVGIDKSNIDFITTLLTSNLYSKPLESFLRETVANAYDSHVEAGTEEPILLLIEDTSGYKTYRISIRDYGIGVSPERFDKIYRNIGSSTKRESNDYIGMFGIGRFSCLSCADVANITSYYQGTKYSYLMYKNGGGINIDKISEIKGDFKDGLEVSIEKSIYSFLEFNNALNHLCLFDKLHVVYRGDNYYLKNEVSSFNERKIANYNTFSWCSLLSSHENYYKVGRVIYEWDSSLAENFYTESGLIIDLPIGSVDITPNREALQYTDYTKRTILSKFPEVQTELSNLINTFVKKSLTLREFHKNFVDDSSYALPIGDKDRLSISEDDITIDWDTVTIDDEPIPENYCKILKMLKWNGIDKDLIYKTLSANGRKFCGNKTIRYVLKGSIELAVKEEKVIKQVAMQYFADSITESTVILTYEGLEEYKKRLIKYLNKTELIPEKEAEDAIEFTFKHLPIKKLSNSNIPSTYIEEYREIQRGKRKKSLDSSKIPIRLYYGNNSYRLSTLDMIPNEGLVLYTTHTKEDDDIKKLADLLYSYKEVAGVITLKSEYIPLVSHNRRFMRVEDVMFTRNNLIGKIATYWIIKNNLLKTSDTILDIPLKKELSKKYHNQEFAVRYVYNNNLLDRLTEYYKEKGWLNEYDIKYFSLSLEEIEAYKYWKYLESRKYDLIQMAAYRKLGRMTKIGLVPVAAPKIQLS